MIPLGLLPPRPPHTHKGDAGHVFVLAGSVGFSGAAALCVMGALRVGAGLVTLTSSATCTGSQRVMGNNVRLIAGVPSFTATYVNASRSVTLTLEIEETSSQLPGGRMTSGVLQTVVKLRNP